MADGLRSLAVFLVSCFFAGLVVSFLGAGFACLAAGGAVVEVFLLVVALGLTEEADFAVDDLEAGAFFTAVGGFLFDAIGFLAGAALRGAAFLVDALGVLGAGLLFYNEKIG